MAAAERLPGVEVKVTFIVAQKRHHIRFFPSGQEGADRKGNSLPGTVVGMNFLLNPDD